jgi:beta-xylosidase
VIKRLIAISLLTTMLTSCVVPVPAPPPASTSSSNTQPIATPRVSTFVNPVYDDDFPDPFVLRDGDAYYAYATNVRSNNVPVLRSTDLVNWSKLGDALPRLPKWAAMSASLTWAPAVAKRGAQYVLYYTARYKKLGLQCISRAVSDNPKGPFVDESTEPFICQRDIGGSIDPSPFVDEGKLYLLWKNDGNCCGRRVSLWLQEMSDDGLNTVGQPVELLRHDQAWETPLIEAPALLKHEDRYYLFYSANGYESSSYAVGYAVADALAGPYTKPLNKPWFASAGKAAGPGGQEFFIGPDGNIWMAYHAWTAGTVGYRRGGKRSLRIDRLTFNDDVPVIAGPTTTLQPAPLQSQHYINQHEQQEAIALHLYTGVNIE